ncbi:MAG: tetratricopeptide repeat protein [Spirulinaceae cyanobacterium]
MFVRCAPAEVADIVGRLRGDLPSKRMESLALEAAVEDLYDCIEQRFEDAAALDVLFVTGLEKSLVDDIRPGIGGQGDYYNEDIMPRVLGNLNLRREQFRDELNCCLVIFGPMFAKKYLLRRAQDFFDWRTSIYEFPMAAEMVEELSLKVCSGGDYDEYFELSATERKDRILEIKDLLEEPNKTLDQQCELFFELGMVFYADGLYQESISSYEKALQIKPDKQKVWYKQGRVLVDLGRTEEAIHSYSHAIEIKPDDHHAWYGKGWALGKLGKYEEAVLYCEQALKVKPDDYIAWCGRGWFLGKLGNYEEAIVSYDRAIEINSDDHLSWNNRGYALNNLGKYEEAILCCDRAIAINSDSYKSWNNWGFALSNLGQYEEAISFYNRAIEIRSDYDLTWYNRGNAFLNLGKAEKAIRSYEHALEIKPDKHEAWYNKSCAHALQNQLNNALESLTKAIELDPKYRELAKTDTDFEPIRHDPRFQTLLNED